MWSGFITGFAEKSVSLIEERDKEIRKSVNSRIEDMFKQASVSKKEAEARREELTSLANQLMGVGFDEAEARALLENPEQAESIIKLVESSPNKMADPETKRRLFQPAAERMAGYAGEKPKDYIKKITTPQRSGVPIVLPTEMRTAFGLRGPIDEGYLSSLGIKEEDLATELPAREVAKPLGLDMSVFRESESFDDRMNAAQLAMLDNPPGSEEHTAAMSVLMKGAAIKEAGKPKGGAEKLTDIRAAFKIADNNILRLTIGKNDSIIVSEDKDGVMSYRFRPKTKASAIDGFNKARKEGLKAFAIETYGDKNGRLPKDVQDILRAYTIEARVVLGDTNKVEAPSAPAAASATKSAAPRMGQGEKPPSVADTGGMPPVPVLRQQANEKIRQLTAAGQAEKVQKVRDDFRKITGEEL